jgi:protease-4
MKKYIFTAAILLLTSIPSYAKINSPFALPPDAQSAAYEAGPFAYMANPVFTDTTLQPHAAYRYISTADDPTHHAVFTIFGFALGYSWYNSAYSIADQSFHKADTAIYSISRGFLLGGVFGFGLGYSAGFSNIDEFDHYRAWNFGLLFRPFSFVSFGASFREAGGQINGAALQPVQAYSVALRPFGEWLTLSADYATGSAYSDDATYSFSGRIDLWQSASIFARCDTSRNFSAGLAISLDARTGGPMNITPDCYASFNSEGPDEYRSAGAAIRFRRGRGSSLPVANNMLFINLAQSYGENEPGKFFAQGRPDFFVLVSGIYTAADDPSINSMLVEIGETDAGFAQIQELRRSIKYFQGRGKKVRAVMNLSGNRQYYLASCADEIYFSPHNDFSITGLRASVYFFKGLMDKAGIEFQSIRRGDYKSFNEPFTRTGMSPEARANLNELITGLNEQYILAITERKNLTREKVQELFDTGLYTPEEAQAKGFIDQVMYSDDLKEILRKDNILLQFEKYSQEQAISTGWGKQPAIAIVYVRGNIVSGLAGGGITSNATGDADYRKMLERVFADSSVRGVVIRVDSGGGSAAASELMWKSLVHLKKAYPKPVVFSFGNTAASGGYYIACTGDKIFAENGTITGSIGVIAGKVSLKELYSKLGISKESITLSEFADLYTESRPLTDSEYRLLDRQTGLIYDRFTQKVIAARKLTAAEVEKVAGGRVHTGLNARSSGLVDEEGGLFTAVDFCRSQCGITGTFRIIQVPDRSGLLQGLSGLEATTVSFGVLDVFFRNLQTLEMLEDQVLYLQPYIIEVE